jgi:hypothetical protein
MEGSFVAGRSVLLRRHPQWDARSLLRSAAWAWLLCLVPFAGHSAPPTFEVVYVESQDRACASSRSYDIKDDWVRELNDVLPGFRGLWSEKGAAMFHVVASLTHRPIEPFVVPVRLTLCDTPSQSFSGPSVNMRFALRSFTKSPVPLRYKVDVAFHESLHGFVAQYAPRGSPLLVSRRSESQCVVNHLHLLALQKAVLLAIGDDAALQQLIAIDSQLPSGCYKRAWALVNETDDTYKQYVADLKNRNP